MHELWMVGRAPFASCHAWVSGDRQHLYVSSLLWKRATMTSVFCREKKSTVKFKGFDFCEEERQGIWVCPNKKYFLISYVWFLWIGWKGLSLLSKGASSFLAFDPWDLELDQNLSYGSCWSCCLLYMQRKNPCKNLLLLEINRTLGLVSQRKPLQKLQSFWFCENMTGVLSPTNRNWTEVWAAAHNCVLYLLIDLFPTLRRINFTLAV